MPTMQPRLQNERMQQSGASYGGGQGSTAANRNHGQEVAALTTSANNSGGGTSEDLVQSARTKTTGPAVSSATADHRPHDREEQLGEAMAAGVSSTTLQNLTSGGKSIQSVLA